MTRREASALSRNGVAVRADGVDLWWVNCHDYGQIRRDGQLHRLLTPEERNAHEDWEPDQVDIVTRLAIVAGKTQA